jgi:dipeptidyl aminopeptidase/acylaminoacyl peptidase
VRRIAFALCVLAGLSAAPSAGPARTQANRLVNGRLAYSHVNLEDVDGYATVVVSDPTGARRKPILIPQEGSGVFTDPDWSPAGTELAVTYILGSRYSGYTSEIYVANAAGKHLRRPITQPKADRRSPAWSPDGAKLAYVQGYDEIWIANADGSGAHAVTKGQDPTWSPDGVRIAFARPEDGNGDDTAGPSRDRAPDWSPDGSQIVFQGGSVADQSLYVVTPDGTGLRRLTHKRYDSAPSWSPDGRKIVFAGGGSVWIMDRDGRHQHNVTHTKPFAHNEDAPAWQPVRVVEGRIQGTAFDDYLAGGRGNDVILGGPGRDVMLGGPGNDTFLARDGRVDLVEGGPGRDRAFIDRHDRLRGVERVHHP